YWDAVGHAGGAAPTTTPLNRPGSTGLWLTDFTYDTGVVLPSAGSTMVVDFVSTAKKQFTDGYTTFNPGADLFPRGSCRVTAPPLVHLDSFERASGPVGWPAFISGENLD